MDLTVTCVCHVQVEKMVAKLTNRVEELAVRPDDGTASLSSHVLVRLLPDVVPLQSSTSAAVSRHATSDSGIGLRDKSQELRGGMCFCVIATIIPVVVCRI